ncbi:hypothetical protein [Streptacidiphilus rugosus]|uniref:hypothetical protein n=1 Tax=Streptacidiphilus rugosus TaxID=405783 RepID=UPI00055CF66C|nr:hypothetical protein [Streptacidiphilus rugosus]
MAAHSAARTTGGGTRGPGWQGPPGGPGGPAGPWGFFPQAPKPGVIPLRPLNVGEIVQAVFTTIRYNFLAVYGPVLITGLGVLAVLGVVGGILYSPLHSFWVDAHDNIGTYGWEPSAGEWASLGVAMGVLLLVFSLGYLAMYVSSSLTSIATLRHAVVGRRVTLRQVTTESRPHVWRLLGATLLMYLVAMGGMIVTAVLVILIDLVTQSPGPVIGFGLLLYLAAAAWGVYAQIRLIPMTSVVILEGARPVAALRRAWRLNEGAWWRSFGVTLVMLLLVGIASQVVMMPYQLFTSSVSGFTPPTGGPLDSAQLQQLMAAELLDIALVTPMVLLVNLATIPITPLTQGLLYIDRRIRRESLDLQLAEEAGIPFWQPQQQAQPTAPQDYPPSSEAL